MSLLVLNNIRKTFGGVDAVKDVSCVIKPGEIVGLIGPNGSGKTTLLNCISRALPITSGSITFNDHPATNSNAAQMARRGLSRTFQSVKLYDSLPVLDNVLLSRNWVDISLLGLFKRASETDIRKAWEILELVGLSDKIYTPANELSGGQKRLVEIAMALMSDPKMLLLDEATSGVNPTLINDIKKIILTINKSRGTSFIIVEHNMSFIKTLVSRIIVLQNGELLADGSPSQILSDNRIVEAYLGA